MPVAVKLFVSYPSEQADLAERLRLALEAEGHDVFTDRAELRAGEAYHAALRNAIAEADAVVFLITPRAVAPGSYTLTELGEAQKRWRRPSGHVLPVLVEPTPVALLPPYLKAVTLLQPRGDAVAETVAAVAALRGGSGRRRAVAAGLALLVLAVAGGGWWWDQNRRAAEQAAAQAAAEAALAARVAAAVSLCEAGNPQAGLDALAALDAAARTRDAAADCAMRWLRDARARSGNSGQGGGFGAIVERAVPRVSAALPDAATAAATPARRADLLAHLGWAEFLRSRDGVPAADPLPQYEAALALDAANVYALAMRGHLTAWRRNGMNDAARADFTRAVATGRERAWVRSMQWGAATRLPGDGDAVVQLADEMRRAGEPLSDRRQGALWSVVNVDLGNGRDGGLGPKVRAALPAERWLATLPWAFPPERTPESWQPRLRFALALLRLGSPQHAAAVAELRALRSELVQAGRDGNIVGQIDAVLSGETSPGRKR
jgi:hypothetical protein